MAGAAHRHREELPDPAARQRHGRHSSRPPCTTAAALSLCLSPAGTCTALHWPPRGLRSGSEQSRGQVQPGDKPSSRVHIETDPSAPQRCTDGAHPGQTLDCGWRVPAPLQCPLGSATVPSTAGSMARFPAGGSQRHAAGTSNSIDMYTVCIIYRVKFSPRVGIETQK